jgi:hypothetical protein
MAILLHLTDQNYSLMTFLQYGGRERSRKQRPNVHGRQRAHAVGIDGRIEEKRWKSFPQIPKEN